MQLCEIYNGATTDSGTYLYGTNQWGNDGSGSQCIYVSHPSCYVYVNTCFFNTPIQVELDDDTTDAASFNATWSWTNNSVWVWSLVVYTNSPPPLLTLHIGSLLP